MNIEKILRMAEVVLDEVRIQCRSLASVTDTSVALGKVTDFLYKQADLTKEMFDSQPRETECKCDNCGFHFWLTMPVKQERELGSGLPGYCIECWESIVENAIRRSAFHDPKFCYRRESSGEKLTRKLKEAQEDRAS